MLVLSLGQIPRHVVKKYSATYTFPFDILVRHNFSILVDKCEWLNHRNGILPLDPGSHRKKKNSYKCNKKHAIEGRLPGHESSLFLLKGTDGRINIRLTQILKNRFATTLLFHKFAFL
jgi:hypothetical protein